MTLLIPENAMGNIETENRPICYSDKRDYIFPISCHKLHLQFVPENSWRRILRPDRTIWPYRSHSRHKLHFAEEALPLLIL